MAEISGIVPPARLPPGLLILRRQRPFWLWGWELLGSPLRILVLPDSACRRLGLSSLEMERICAVLAHCRGRLLDIGCGNNRLVREHGDGVGVDVHDWRGGGLVVEDAARLPFESESFDTVSFVACLNHIPNRIEVLNEAHRLLKPDGRLLVTMINPLLGWLNHTLCWYSEDRHRGGMAAGERHGLWPHQVHDLSSRAGFEVVSHLRFLYGLNHLYLAKRREQGKRPS